MTFVPRAPSPPSSPAAPESGGKQPAWCSEIVHTEGSSQNAACVPLPWWASQSTTATRSIPCAACACMAASAVLAKMQPPMP